MYFSIIVCILISTINVYVIYFYISNMFLKYFRYNLYLCFPTIPLFIVMSKNISPKMVSFHHEFDSKIYGSNYLI